MISSVESEGDSGARLKVHNTLFPLRGEEMRVELDKKSLFALASDTRVEILRTLLPMRRTVTQLSEALEIDKAAVHRHLKKMEEGGLVRRYEDHGFVYYGLSWKARDLMSPNENTRIVILLSLSWILCIAVVFLLAFALIGGGSANLNPARGPGNQQYGDQNALHERSYVHLGPASPLWIISAGLVAVAAVLLAYRGYSSLRRPRQKLPSPQATQGQD
jgi:DNA-binding transcriptional ArsR family regulator